VIKSIIKSCINTPRDVMFKEGKKIKKEHRKKEEREDQSLERE
jgi:hypothetical protein